MCIHQLNPIKKTMTFFSQLKIAPNFHFLLLFEYVTQQYFNIFKQVCFILQQKNLRLFKFSL